MLEYEYDAHRYLNKAEEYIRKSIQDGNYVWITTSDDKKILLDENCKIGYLKMETVFI